MRVPAVASHVISASAGTGKTFQLTARFIALLALGAPPSAMVALTFTRKAAQEFQERIITTLARGAENEEQAQRLAEVVRRTWQGTPDGAFPPLCPVADEGTFPLSRERFGELLRLVVAEMSRLHLSTLDSFFQSLVSMGQVELGLARMELVTEAALRRARRQALEALLADIDADDEKQEENWDALRAVAESQEMDVVAALEKAVGIYAEVYRALPVDALWGAAEAFGLPDVSGHRRMSQEEAEACQRRVKALVGGLGLKEGLVRDLGALPMDIAARKYATLKAIRQVRKALADHLSPEWEELDGLLGRLERQAKNDVLQAAVRRSRSMARLMRCYLAAYQVEVQDRGYLEYADVTRLVPRLLLQEGVPSLLAYRMDARLKHWMLDEFQDTSRAQWEALLPLLQGIAEEAGASPDHAAERSLFVVGDVKQSIYRWRGGEPGLFRHLVSASPWKEALQPVEMNLSWRSSPVVMQFVNRVFAGDPLVQEHRAACRAEEKPGYIGVDCLPKAKKEGTLEAACERMREILESLPLREKAMSVGIIARTNTQVGEICARLRSLCPDLPIEMEGQRTPLTQSPMGEVLLALFRWLCHPSDEYRRAELVQSPLWRCCGRKLRSWQAWAQLLQEQGYAGVVRTMGACLMAEPGLLSDYHRYQLDAWLQEAVAFDAAGGSLQDWVERMQDLSMPAAPPKHAVHVLTIHGCKGLEYDAVILPFLEAPQVSGFDNTRHLDYYTACDAEGRVTGLMMKDAALREWWGDQLAEAEERWKEAAVAEGRNLLYVALTRAVHANYVLLNGAQSPNGKSLGGIVKQALGEECPEPGFGIGIGDEDWAFHAKLDDRLGKDFGEEDVCLPEPGRRYRKRRPSEEGGEEISVPQLMGGATRGREDSLALGTAVHALLEPLVWWEENACPAWYRHPHREEEVLLAKALKVPEIRALFMQKKFPLGAQVYNEQALERAGEGEWISAVVDRLVVCPDGRALVVDYKTNQDATDLAERYQGQMEAYRRLVAEALGIPRAQVSVCLAALGCAEPHLVWLGEKFL